MKMLAALGAAALLGLAGCEQPPPPAYAPPQQPRYAPPPPPPPPVAGPMTIPQRIENQERRVSQDQQQGRIAPVVAQQARERLASIRYEFNRFRQINGGYLLPGQQADLNRRLDNTLGFISNNER